MKKIEKLIATFDSGDTLSLETKTASFFGFQEKQIVLELAYNERHEGRYDGTQGVEGEHHFMVMSTEYFAPEKMEAATAAFLVRLTSETPANITGMAQRLEDFLIVNEKEIRRTSLIPLVV